MIQDLRSSTTGRPGSSLLRSKTRTPTPTSAKQQHSVVGPSELEYSKALSASDKGIPQLADDCEHNLIALNSALLQVTPKRLAKKAAASPKQLRKNYTSISSDDVDVDVHHNLTTIMSETGGPECSSISGHELSRSPTNEDENRTNSSSGPASIPDMAGLPCSSAQGEQTNQHAQPPLVALPHCCTEGDVLPSFSQSNNRFCTSFRLKVHELKNPVDLCALPNRCLAIADYDNGFVVLNRNGDVVKHQIVLDRKNACGVATAVVGDEFFLLILAYKEGVWSIILYGANFEFIDSISCPEDPQIETWALRKLAVTPQLGLLYLMATGEHKSVIWSLELTQQAWKVLVTENSRRGSYNDLAVRYDESNRDTHFLLVDWKKGQLSSVVVTEAEELAGVQAIKMKRIKGQEWIVRGPKLACWDEDSDIVLFDGSGKLFWFDGNRFRFKKIIGDVGKGEVGAVAARDGWCYALCRYRLCVEAFLYKECAETTL